MANEWYYARDGKQFGPFSFEQLEQFAGSRQLQPEDHVWGHGFQEWLVARAVPGLFSFLGAGETASGMGEEIKEGALALAGLAVRGVCEAVELGIVAGVAEGAVKFLAKYFLDQSERLPRALQKANQRAWRTLELALAGDTLLEKFKEKTSRAEDQAFVSKLREFLQTAELPGLSGKKQFRLQCLAELRQAREKGKLDIGDVQPEPLARKTVDFARFNDPKKRLDAEWGLIEVLIASLKPDYGNLAWLLAQKPPQGPPLLVLAVRYYFRREVEENEQLFQGLVFSQLEGISQAQQENFDWLLKHGERVEGLLAELRQQLHEIRGGVKRVEDKLATVQQTGEETRSGVLRIEEELRRQGPHYQQVYQMLQELQNKLEVRGKQMRSGVSFSIRDEEERREVKAFLARYRNVSTEDRRARPALVNAVAQLEVAAGEFDAAEQSFQEAATSLNDRKALAEVHHNRYVSYLEKRDWDKALDALLLSAQLAPDRFTPFPLHKYKPRRILGAGGFGVAFLCENLNTGAEVVLKTLRAASGGRDVQQVLREARLLGGLRHPAIVQLYDCDFADSACQRAYLVMEYFDPRTLEQHVAEAGPVTPEALLPLAVQVAEGLQAAHDHGVLHRDIKPANILVRRGATGTEVRVIDFGLALSQEAHSQASTARRSLTDSKYIAGTQDYAAPEQMGRLEGVKVGVRADIYGFGKTCCYALFKTPQPTFQHWQKLPAPLAELLGQCLAENPDDRPASFTEVITRLRGCLSGVLPVLKAVGVGAAGAGAPMLSVIPAAKGPPPVPQWHYLRGGQQQGPVPEPRLLEMIRTGQVGPADLVWKQGLAGWVPAGSIATLFRPGKAPGRPPVLAAAGPSQKPPTLKPAATTGEQPKVAAPVTGTVRLEALSGIDPKGGVLDIFLDNQLLGSGSAASTVEFGFATSPGAHEILVRGRYPDRAAGATKTPEEKFPICFSIKLEQPGRYTITLHYRGEAATRKNATGATPPNKIVVKRVE
jgi:hypothetical protein